MTERAPSTGSVVVTGAASGIGLAAVRLLLERGHQVVAMDVDGDNLRDACGPDDPSCHCLTGDVSNEADVERAISEAVSRYGMLGGIFNNAGVLGDLAPIDEYDGAAFRRVLEINVMGTLFGTKHAIRAFRRAGRGGSIVNTASAGGLTGAPDLAAYIASKHAVIGLTRTAALETTADGITVNALCPGMVDTPMLDAVRQGRIAHERPPESAPVARAATPEEIAATAYWLLFERPVYLTGAVIPVDGGFTAQ